MSKSFQILTSGPVLAQIGATSTLINTGSSAIFLTDAETEKALEVLEETHKQAVLSALHSIQPGKTVKLTAGKYTLDLGQSLQASAVLLEEFKQPAKPAKAVVPAVPVIPVVPAVPADNQQPAN